MYTEDNYILKMKDFCDESCMNLTTGQKAKVTRYLRVLACSKGINDYYTKRGMFHFDHINKHVKTALGLAKVIRYV